VTQQNAALVEQAAAAAESLEEQARGLAEAVGTFKLAGGVSGQIRPVGKNVGMARQKLAAPARITGATKPPIQLTHDGEWAEF